MGVQMADIQRGALDFGKIISSGMDAWDRVARSTGLLPTGGVVATSQTSTPAVTPTSQTTQQSAGLKISGTMLLIGGLVIAAVFWRRG